MIIKRQKNGKNLNYENKMLCDRGDLDADFPWWLSGYGKRGSEWRNAGIFHCG